MHIHVLKYNLNFKIYNRINLFCWKLFHKSASIAITVHNHYVHFLYKHAILFPISMSSAQYKHIHTKVKKYAHDINVKLTLIPGRNNSLVRGRRNSKISMNTISTQIQNFNPFLPLHGNVQHLNIVNKCLSFNNTTTNNNKS